MDDIKQQLKKQKLEDKARKIGCYGDNYRLFKEHLMINTFSFLIYAGVFWMLGFLYGILW